MSRTTPQPGRIKPSQIPPLQNGDRLTRDEFERRYDATPGLKKAELIEGRVYVAPPVSHLEHGRPHAEFIGILLLYRVATQGVDIGDNSSLRLDLKNMPQPDVFMMIAPEMGGQAKIDEDGYIIGAPELIAEIAASSVSYDLHDKLEVYRRHQVREYIVWRTQEKQFDFFVLENHQYRRAATRDGVFRSTIFPGLWVDSTSLSSGDINRAADIMQQGLASLEHQAFVEQLQHRSTKH